VTAPTAVPGQEVLSGPERVGSQRLWRLQLPDGRRAVLEQLLPELAREEAVRRRYVRDAERLQALSAARLAEVIAVGPDWRLRRDVGGESLEKDLAARAPLPVDEALALGAELADLVHDVHRRGGVLRDLQPRQIVRAHDGLWLTDVGLARVDILSTRTASSVILEGSPYASPEHLGAARVDARSDLYSIGVIVWRALTGALPFGDVPAFLREPKPLPALAELRPGVPDGTDELLRACLAEDPADRPASARDVAAALRGELDAPRALARIRCQACGAALPLGLRLCVECGRQSVQFTRAPEGTRAMALELVRLKEDAKTLQALHELLELTSAAPLPPLNFLVGDARMYDKEEREGLIKLPARLFDDLSPESSQALKLRIDAIGGGIKTRELKVTPPEKTRRTGQIMVAMSVAGLLMAALGGVAGATTLLAIGFPVVIFLAAFGTIAWYRGNHPKKALLSLRRGPALLPAGDPLVARLAALMTPASAPDVRRQVTELAILVQRLADRRAEASQMTAAELELVLEPVSELVGALETEVKALTGLDDALASLDEGTMVRALAASEARKEPAARREPILAGLDKLRSLEDERARRMERLLETGSLLRRAVELALRTDDTEAQMERDLKAAMAALDDD